MSVRWRLRQTIKNHAPILCAVRSEIVRVRVLVSVLNGIHVEAVRGVSVEDVEDSVTSG